MPTGPLFDQPDCRLPAPTMTAARTTAAAMFQLLFVPRARHTAEARSRRTGAKDMVSGRAHVLITGLIGVGHNQEKPSTL
jgi:hypothetical protein